MCVLNTSLPHNPCRTWIIYSICAFMPKTLWTRLHMCSFHSWTSKQQSSAETRLIPDLEVICTCRLHSGRLCVNVVFQCDFESVILRCQSKSGFVCVWMRACWALDVCVDLQSSAQRCNLICRKERVVSYDCSKGPLAQVCAPYAWAGPVSLPVLVHA